MNYLTNEKISIDYLLQKNPKENCGAVSFFAGVVRDHHNGRGVKKLYYDCYVPLANKEIGRIIGETFDVWDVESIDVIHRIGEIQIGEVAVAIAVHSKHRHEAFSACRKIIDDIKKTVPIWKNEFYQDGTHEWVYCSEHSKKDLVIEHV